MKMTSTDQYESAMRLVNFLQKIDMPNSTLDKASIMLHDIHGKEFCEDCQMAYKI